MIDENSFSNTSENLYKRIFKNFPILAYIWKRRENDLILIDFSSELEKICNINLEKHKGVKASELYEDEPEILNDLKRCLNEKSIISKEMVYKFKLIKREKYVNVTYRYIPEDLVLVYVEDISGQKEIEETLKKEEKEKSIVLGSISEHIIYYNKDFNIISANKSAADSINLNPEELIGRKCYELWHNRNEPCEGCPVLEAFKVGKLITSEMKTPDGRVWLVKGHPVYDNKGDIIGVVEITREVTQLKQTEQKLKESELRYKNLVERLKDAIFQVDLKNNIIFANKASLDIFGYSPEEFKEIPGLTEKILHPDYKQRFEEFWSNYNSNKKFPEQTTEWCWIRKDGKVVYTENTFINLFDINNRNVGFETVARDITEKKKAEIKLKESEEKYRNLVNNILDQIIETNLDGTITYVSPQVFNIFGFKPEEVLGKKSIDFVHPDDSSILKESMQRAIDSGGVVSPEFRIRHKSGHYIPVSSRGNLIKKEGTIKLVSVIRDISEQKLAEQKLKESEERFRKFFKGSPYYATAWRKVGNDFFVIDINENYKNAIKEDLSEVIGISASDMFLKHQYRPDLIKALNQCYSEKTTFTKEIELYVEAIDRERNLLVTLIYIPPDLVLTVSEDITRKKRAQQKLEESEEKYRKAYNRADFYKDLFAHDMNNILQNIYSASQLSVMNLNDKKDPEKLKENFDIILDQVNRGARLVSNVRKLTRLEESEIKLEPIDALGILYKSIDFIKNAYQNRDIDIQVNSKITKLILNANNLLEDVFENILINAIKYNENTPIKILIQISKDLKDDEGYIKFEFKDNGIGIDDSRKKDIFLRNHQTEVSHRGMGLGLSLVRKIIANYKGHIWVEDKVSGDYEKGSNFVILIPEVN